MEGRWSEFEKSGVQQALSCSVIGAPDSVARGIETFIARHQPDELLITGLMFDHRARLRSFEIAAQARDELASAVA